MAFNTDQSNLWQPIRPIPAPPGTSGWRQHTPHLFNLLRLKIWQHSVALYLPHDILIDVILVEVPVQTAACTKSARPSLLKKSEVEHHDLDICPHEQRA